VNARDWLFNRRKFILGTQIFHFQSGFRYTVLASVTLGATNDWFIHSMEFGLRKGELILVCWVLGGFLSGGLFHSKFLKLGMGRSTVTSEKELHVFYSRSVLDKLAHWQKSALVPAHLWQWHMFRNMCTVLTDWYVPPGTGIVYCMYLLYVQSECGFLALLWAPTNQNNQFNVDA
jgi:hypothetical protein